MNNIWSYEIDSILKIGRPLGDVGVRNWALDKSSTLAALERLRLANIGISGGDVYTVSGNDVRPNYDNWYCNCEPGETHEDFVRRSIRKAMHYVSNYQSSEETTLFAIVPSLSSGSVR